LNIRAKHNIANYDLQLPVEATIKDLSEKILELTGVPIAGQKIIFCGKQLPKDLAQPLTEAGLGARGGNKIMILGKRYDPASDESYKAILTLETRAAASEKKVLEITAELDDIDRGHLDKSLHQEASKSLQKRVKSINEELQKLLEGLDSLQLAEDQLDAKVKRKSVATPTEFKRSRGHIGEGNFM